MYKFNNILSKRTFHTEITKAMSEPLIVFHFSGLNRKIQLHILLYWWIQKVHSTVCIE